ncbi:unnamed protein product [Lactuca virosa]|uniref:Protein kinase domain-containing protein n=1 Tax=Lactuca virosa TaxID=75947 RepID=A0AAU9MLG6_9ASTR|nr:unnamed protein product [Lactuca virosa]
MDQQIMDAILKEFQHLKIQLEAIKSATGNFDNSNLIGKGGFGKVYEGVLSDSYGEVMVAFKRLDRNYGQGDPEFWKEILILSCYTHENLISLLGFCNEDGEKILVYDRAFRGSLDRHLSATNLTWRQRLKICLGAATGLCYLHDPKGTQQRVLHRDIKSSNILLDENWNAKVSDMGLSKLGPANQQHTILVSNVVGTLGYIDPVYMETGILTKESDVYSFGVILFEVLCGRLCFEYKNGHFQSLVGMWKKSYKQKRLNKIIFKDLKQQMDQRSLETFSDIAYQCLQKSRKRRPMISHVVEKLEIALRFQEIGDHVEPLMDYQEIIKIAVPSLAYSSTEELKMHLFKGILVDKGTTWFINKNGERCEMISATKCLEAIRYAAKPQTPFDISYFRDNPKSEVDYYMSSTPLFHGKTSRISSNIGGFFYMEFKTHVIAQFLSLHTTYTVNLVFLLDPKLKYTDCDVNLKYILAGETKHSTSYLADEVGDGWLIAELYQFTSTTRTIELEITFESSHSIAVDSIVFMPLERVEDIDTDWEPNLPHWKEIINGGEQWFSLAKNGKTCFMQSAREALDEKGWSWTSSPESRFKQVAFDPVFDSFQIYCRPRMQSLGKKLIKIPTTL